MLSKLFKYELKATARLFLPIYLTILIFAVINRFFFSLPNMGESMTISSIMMFISMLVYVSLMIGMVLMTLVVMIQRFYKNLLGDEGYLMFTLPVQSWKHILSKLTTSMLWTIASGIVALFSILIISSKEIFTPEFLKELPMVLNVIKEYLGSYTYIVGFEMVVLCLLSLSTTILTIYAAISLGHLFNKYKLLASFGMYIVLETISQIFMTIFVFLFWNQAIFRMEVNFIPSASQISTFTLFTIFYFGAITAAYFTLTNYILKKKLNLE